MNNSLDEILAHCSLAAFVSIIGPTAGYFPDPLFARGVDVVGGRVVKKGKLFLQLLAEKNAGGMLPKRSVFRKRHTRVFFKEVELVFIKDRVFARNVKMYPLDSCPG